MSTQEIGKELPWGWGCEVVFLYIQTKPPEKQEEKSTALYKCSQNMPRDVHWKAFYPIFCLHIKDVFQVCRFSEKPNW